MGNRVSLFVTCMVDQLFPKVGMAMADVLERLGYAIDFPEEAPRTGRPHSANLRLGERGLPAAFGGAIPARGGPPALPAHCRPFHAPDPDRLRPQPRHAKARRPGAHRSGCLPERTDRKSVV